MKNVIRFAGLLLVLAVVLSGCGGTTVTVSPTPSSDTSAASPVKVIPAGDDDLGLVMDSYSFPSATTMVTIEEFSGDTDILEPKLVRATYDSLSYRELELVFDAKFPVAFTAEHYTNGEVVSDGGIQAMDKTGFIESQNLDGSWHRAAKSGLRTPIPFDYDTGSAAAPAPAMSDIATLDEDGAVRISPPYGTPGTYRYTLYFREGIDLTRDNLTTGEELYMLTVTIVIPVSDREYDIVALCGAILTSVQGDRMNSIYALIRSNDKDILEQNFSKGLLEYRDGNEWKEVTDGVILQPGDIWGDITHSAFYEDDHLLGQWSGFLPVLADEYRLTGYLNDTHSGKYEFTIQFSFEDFTPSN